MTWKLIDNQVVNSKKKAMRIIPNVDGYESRLAIFLGGHCTHIHLVDLLARAGKDKISSHEDLDVWHWLPKAPYLLSCFTALNAGRSTFTHTPESGAEAEDFVFVYFDQRTMFSLRSPEMATNHLVDSLVMRSVDWYGEILVIKTISASGRVLNMREADFKLLPAFLIQLVELEGVASGDENEDSDA